MGSRKRESRLGPEVVWTVIRKYFNAYIYSSDEIPVIGAFHTLPGHCGCFVESWVGGEKLSRQDENLNLRQWQAFPFSLEFSFIS